MPVHPLEMLYREAVHVSLEENLGLRDAEIVAYMARMLCGFTAPADLYKLRDRHGRPIEELEEMLLAADPVYGMAASFDAERAARKFPAQL